MNGTGATATAQSVSHPRARLHQTREHGVGGPAAPPISSCRVGGGTGPRGGGDSDEDDVQQRTVRAARAVERDRRARERDDRATERDTRATEREAAGDLSGAAADREAARADRSAAEVDRLHAARDLDA
jgi:hypothetical protein